MDWHLTWTTPDVLSQRALSPVSANTDSREVQGRRGPPAKNVNLHQLTRNLLGRRYSHWPFLLRYPSEVWEVTGDDLWMTCRHRLMLPVVVAHLQTRKLEKSVVGRKERAIICGLHLHIIPFVEETVIKETQTSRQGFKPTMCRLLVSCLKPPAVILPTLTPITQQAGKSPRGMHVREEFSLFLKYEFQALPSYWFSQSVRRNWAWVFVYSCVYCRYAGCPP